MNRTGLRAAIPATLLIAGMTCLAFGQNLFVNKGLGHSAGKKWAPGELVVQFKKGVSQAEIDKVNRGLKTSLLARAKHGRFMRLKVPKGKKIQDMVQAYKSDPRVEYAEPNYMAQAHMVPDDPKYSPYQWNFGDMGGMDINMEAAWDIAGGGDQSVVVAVLDCGVAYENYGNKFRKAPDLANTHFVQGYDFVNNDAHANDDNGHGTHVAGTIAQSTNNAIGVAGIAFGVSIMPVKVLDKDGSGYHSWIADGIYFAADNGAKVINLSLGGPASETMEAAVAYAYNQGVTIVCSGGNERGEGSPVSYPAAYNAYCIAVAATRYDGAGAYYSNIGDYIDIAAPGGDVTVDQNGDGNGDGILQNTINQTNKNPRDFGYWLFQGTSMAAPHVSGVAALLLSQGVATSPDMVRQALQETAEDLGPAGVDPEYGHGLVDAAGALNYQWVQNTQPVAVDDADATDEDAALDIDVLANDYDDDGDNLSISSIADPAHGTADKKTVDGYDMVAYTPYYNFNGDDTFEYTINDGMGGTATATVTITVNPINDPPFADDDTALTNQDVAVIIDVLANDWDPDGDNIAVANLTQPANGTAADNGNGTVTYTPNPGYTGTDEFTYQASDGQALSEAATVLLTVTEVNDPPQAADDTYDTDEDQALNIPAPGVLGNDTDPNGHALSVNPAPVSGPSSGALILNDDGSFTYTPNTDFNGADEFEYEVSDGNGGLDSGLVSITVNPINDAPVAGGDAYSTDQDQTLNVAAPGLLGNDSDVEGDVLSVTALITGPNNGSLTLNPDGSFTYIPDPGFSGSDNFEYEISDGNGELDVAMVTINVTAAGVTVIGITPSSAVKGTTVDVTVNGSGFASGAELSFEGGDGPAPIVSNVLVVDGGSLTATVKIKSGGPPKLRYWDVRVTNPDASTDVLADGFTVTP